MDVTEIWRAACNERSRVPRGGNLRRSEIFRPTATSKRFVVGLPERNASRFPPLSVDETTISYVSRVGLALLPSHRFRPNRTSTVPRTTGTLSIGCYLFRTSGWMVAPRYRADRSLFSPSMCAYICKCVYIRAYERRRWRFIAFMQH